MRLIKFFAAAMIGVLSCSICFGYSGGDGTTGNPYQIMSKADLLELAGKTGDYRKHFILTHDIDMGDQVFTTAIIAPDANSFNPTAEFRGTSFTGILDGNGHKITHFIINGGLNSYLGLFGNIGNQSQIKNLVVENCTINSVGPMGSVYVGGLVGRIDGGSISGCHVTVSINSSDFVGGLAGYNHGGFVNSCYATVSINCNFRYVGGLVGCNSGGYISDCYSKGAITGSSIGVGGLAGRNGDDWGYNDGYINNCYSTCDVSGISDVGGLVGYIMFGTIGNCYSTGLVNGNRKGGLLGYKGGSSIIASSFWDVQTSETNDGVGGVDPDPVGAIGKTTEEMKALATFTNAGWYFANTWAICEGTNYPRLAWQIPEGDFACPDGVSVEDLDYFVERWLLDNCTSTNNYCGGADMDISSKVDLGDFFVLTQHWLEM
jgi:hypothetical protein